jgi:small-conductance mechanosensitive channel
VAGILILVGAVVVARVLRMFLDRRMQAQKRLDAGVRYSVVRLVTYTIVTAGLLLALKTSFHIDLTSLAVLFTALSVGIGFGLQFIAGDVAAGFILLFERPVKIGDFVTFSGPDSKMTEGRVHSINLRTTVVMTNDNVAAIVPNSELTNRKVINWSYRERRSRVSVYVGVAYDSDVELVTRTLLRAAEGVSFVLAEPKPGVQFLEFGESDLKFRLLVWTDHPRRHPQIKSDINYRIRQLFLEEGIEIPFPQRDIRITGGRLRLEGDAPPAATEDEEEALHDYSRR